MLKQLNVFAEEDIHAAAEALNDVMIPIALIRSESILLVFIKLTGAPMLLQLLYGFMSRMISVCLFLADAHQEALHVDRDGSTRRARRSLRGYLLRQGEDQDLSFL